LQNVKRGKKRQTDYTLIKLFEKNVYMSSIVLDNSLEALFSLINAAVESLPATPFETVDQLKRVLLIECNKLSDFHQQQH